MNPRSVLALLVAVTAAVVLLLRLPGQQEPTSPAAEVAAPQAPLSGVVTPQPQLTGVETPATPTGETSADAPPHTGDLDDDAAVHDDAAGRRRPEPAATSPAESAAAAAAFAAAWTRHDGADARTWATRLSALSTATLTAKLAAVDPDVVPADAVTGTPVVTLTIPGTAHASVPTNAGTLRLSLLHTDRWRVDTLDWTPA